MSIYFKEELHLDPSVSSIIKTIAKQPWNFKILYGVLYDCKPYTKRFMIMSCSFILVGIVLMILTSVHGSVAVITIALLILSLGGAFSDVIADGEMVRISQKSENSDELNAYLQSLSWTTFGIGGICGTLLGGTVVKYYGTAAYFIMLLPFPIILIVVTLLYNQVPASFCSIKLFGSKIVKVVIALQQPKVFKPLIFVLIQNATGIGIGEGMNYFRLSIGMDAQILGIADTFAYLGLIMGSILFNKYFSKTSIAKIIFITTLISAAVSLLDLVQLYRWNIAIGISDLLFLIGYDVVQEVIGRLNMMPLMVLAAKFCPDAIEATMFATMMSIFNFTSDIGTLFGSYLLNWYDIREDNYVGMDKLIVLRAILSCFPLFWLSYLKNTEYTQIQQDIPLIPIKPSEIAPDSPRKRLVLNHED